MWGWTRAIDFADVYICASPCPGPGRVVYFNAQLPGNFCMASILSESCRDRFNSIIDIIEETSMELLDCVGTFDRITLVV